MIRGRSNRFAGRRLKNARYNRQLLVSIQTVLKRKSALVLLLAVLLSAAPACKRQRFRSQQTEEEPARLASTVRMGDPLAAHQLMNGFYDIEAHAWRWTQRQFAVRLRPPSRAARNGASLEVHLTVPQPSIDKLQSLTLSSSIAGTALAPETYTKAGNYTYKRDVPASLLGGDSVRVDFQLDKAVPPGGGDLRELGIVVLSAGLLAK